VNRSVGQANALVYKCYSQSADGAARLQRATELHDQCRTAHSYNPLQQRVRQLVRECGGLRQMLDFSTHPLLMDGVVAAELLTEGADTRYLQASPAELHTLHTVYSDQLFDLASCFGGGNYARQLPAEPKARMLMQSTTDLQAPDQVMVRVGISDGVDQVQNLERIEMMTSLHTLLCAHTTELPWGQVRSVDEVLRLSVEQLRVRIMNVSKGTATRLQGLPLLEQEQEQEQEGLGMKQVMAVLPMPNYVRVPLALPLTLDQGDLLIVGMCIPACIPGCSKPLPQQHTAGGRFRYWAMAEVPASVVTSVELVEDTPAIVHLIPFAGLKTRSRPKTQPHTLDVTPGCILARRHMGYAKGNKHKWSEIARLLESVIGKECLDDTSCASISSATP
jgi:hypothetical protein